MIPGSNLLNQALTVIAKQAVIYHKALGRALNDIGQDVTVYDDPVKIYGSFQPVPKNLYDALGLNLQKSYYAFYTSNNVIDLQRNLSNDQLTFGNYRYQCESNTEWFLMDGWKSVLCCQLTSTNENILQSTFGFNTNTITNPNLNFENGDFQPD